VSADSSRNPRSQLEHATRRRDRRRVLRRAAAWAIGAPFATALVAMLNRHRESRQPEAVQIPADVPDGFSALGSALVFRGQDGVRAYSSRCPHLGCRIDRGVDDRAVCPCHGSSFHADGTVATGPATRPLVTLRLEPDPETGGWTAHAP